MQNHIEKYRKQGFTEVQTDSGTGSYVLVHQEQGKVVKFNQDPAYDKFVTFVLQNPMPALPKVFRHEKPLGEFNPQSNDVYTVTEMELLVPLSGEEQQSVLAWVEAAFKWLRVGSDIAAMSDDPHDLRSAFDCLSMEAINAGVSLDVIKGSNYMKRVSENMSCVVITDPFN